MKKMSVFGCIVAALLSFVGCEELGNEFEGTNYIYLSEKSGKSTMLETDTEPLTIEVMLTKALEEDLSITFKCVGKDGVVELQGNPVKIAAGQKTATFTVVSLNAGVLEAAENYSIAVESALPEGVELKEQFQFVVNYVEKSDLTAEQKAILDAYKVATGIDLSKYLGVVTVNAVITGTDPETCEPLDPQTVTGSTVIALSEESTAEAPVLKMLSNPMGIQDYMYGVFRSVTVDYEDWYSEYALECYTTLMNAIEWTPESQEVFSMSLDGITFNADKNIDFLATYVDEYDEECVRVPFEYSFTAYDREIAAIEGGVIDPENDDEWAPDATANPAAHLNNSDITEDWFECGNFVESTAVIDESGLTFTFCVYGCWLDSDFTRVVATYTPNN